MRRARPFEPVAFVLPFLWAALAAAAPAAAAAPNRPAAPSTAGTPTLAQLLNDVEQDGRHRAAVAGMLEKAKAALGRAHAMDQAGDVTRAALTRAVAREWLACARDLARTNDAEDKAEKAEKNLDDLETKRIRGQALLEETIARRGRAQALLDQLEHEPKPQDLTDRTRTPANKDKPGVKKSPPVNE